MQILSYNHWVTWGCVPVAQTLLFSTDLPQSMIAISIYQQRVSLNRCGVTVWLPAITRTHIYSIRSEYTDTVARYVCWSRSATPDKE